MTGTDPFVEAWQASVAEAPLPPLDDLRKGADLFYRRIRRRNRVEYSAAALVVLCFGAYCVLLPSLIARIGSLLVVLGTLFATWQLDRRASAIAVPPAEAALPLVAHQRAQLVRQRDALASVGRWYLLPLVPGLAVMMIGPTIAGGPAALLNMGRGQIFGILAAFLVFGGVWWLNRRAAKMLGKAIADIDALRGDQT
jgi:hypothetical protein